VWGEPSFTSELFPEFYYFSQVHDGRYFVQRRHAADVVAFDPPLTASSTPALSVKLQRQSGFDGYPVLGLSGTVAPHGYDFTDFALSPSGNEMWVADLCNSRVLRIANINGPPASRYVDVILGQGDIGEAVFDCYERCNRGDSSCPLGYLGQQWCPNADRLCYPAHVQVDEDGNVYVGDSGNETGSSNRILEFDASRFEFQPGETTAKIGLVATRVFGAGGVFDQTGGRQNVPDPMVRPFKPVFLRDGGFAVGNNPYDSGFGPAAGPFRFASVYLHPLVDRLPQFVLGDLTGYPDNASYYDPSADTLFFADKNWARVLVSRDVLHNVPIPGCGAYRETIVNEPAAGFWRLGESSGTQATNEMGGPDGTYVGSATLGVASGFVNGSDTAVDFSAAHDYVAVPDAATLRLTDSFAIELWVRINQLGQHGTLLNRNGRYAVQYGFGTQADSVEFSAVAYGGTCDPRTGSEIVLGDTEWHHIAYTYDRESRIWAGYKDGRQVFAKFCDFVLSPDPGPLFIGAADAATGNIDAAIDEVALYATPVDAWDVRGHFATSQCEPFAVRTATPRPTHTLTPTPTPTATATPLGCGTVPDAGCRLPFVAGKASLLIVDKTADARDGLKWRWLRGSAASELDFGTPLSTTHCALCVYDANGLVLDANVPMGSAWQTRRHGFKYKSKSGAPDGVTQVQLKAGADGKAQVIVQGKGGALGVPALETLVQPLRVQLRNSAGSCWEAVYSAPPKRGTSTIFSDRAD
jgi:Concanavalin A-like lectin/glucanases superfamily